MKLEALTPELSRQAVLTIQTLSMDAVEKAKSGHPGMPMGTADLSFVLWTCFLKINPAQPKWVNRDRFVLSAGHGSMLLYSLLHLSGFDVSLDDLKNFRQWGSKTPGHPEFGHTPGVEATTGPLGQGTANAVGMAIAEKMLAQKFNRDGHKIIDHKIYALVGDGDLMEGISSEAASLAGHLGLDNLVFIYDSNRISIDGATDITFTENIAQRFIACQWTVHTVDGHNHAEIEQALTRAKTHKGSPTLIIANTHIAKGAPTKQDTASSHGAPLGEKEIAEFKTRHGLNPATTFDIPSDVKALFSKRIEQWKNDYAMWELQFRNWQTAHPDLANEWRAFFSEQKTPSIYDALLKDASSAAAATRNISSDLQQKLFSLVPNLVSGSADLAGSTFAVFKKEKNVTKEDFGNRNIAYGVREHAMGAIGNGLALSGFIPITSTFLIFSDYMRPAIRVAALSNLQSIFVFTHDSFYLGEDGPTHQPIEHLGSLRLIPNLFVFRPFNTRECASAWEISLQRKSAPSALLLTRQKLSNIDTAEISGPSYGGYIFKESSTAVPEVILAASGSEVDLALQAQANLEAVRISTRVVSMPCMELFAQQSEIYRNSILPKHIPTVVLEAARCDLWYKWISSKNLLVEMNTFGASAPDAKLAQAFGFTTDQVVQKVSSWLKERTR